MMMWWVVLILAALAGVGLVVYALKPTIGKRSLTGKFGKPLNHVNGDSASPNAATAGADQKKTDNSRPAALSVKQKTAATNRPVSANGQSFDHQAEQDVEHIFNDSFREELRNRGRLHFEKIIGENAMFLQQDLRLTTSQLNDYMKQEITTKLKEEFTKYEQSIVDAKEVAIDAIEKTKQAVDDNRVTLLKQMEQEFAEEKTREIKRFDENMTNVINHYLVAAIGDQIDLSDQLEYIVANLEANKQAIIQDLINGA